LQYFDLTYSSDLTSAAVDAFHTSLPVVVLLDKAELNFSPPRGNQSMCFVRTHSELAEALHNKVHEKIDSDGVNSFYLDPGLLSSVRLIKLDLSDVE
jgi:hypothetical protein